MNGERTIKIAIPFSSWKRIALLRRVNRFKRKQTIRYHLVEVDKLTLFTHKYACVYTHTLGCGRSLIGKETKTPLLLFNEQKGKDFTPLPGVWKKPRAEGVSLGIRLGFKS